MEKVKKIFILTYRIVRVIWKLLTGGIIIASALLMMGIWVSVFYMSSQQAEIIIPDGSALVLAPYGKIVEEKSPLNPITSMLNEMTDMPVQKELLLQDVIDGIRAAANDTRIKLLVIAPGSLEQTSLNQIQDIGRAIDRFKESGKVVISFADNFNQAQYYLASWSDEIYLNPMGAVNMQGFGLFRLYMRELIEKLNINFHIFKVGTFKSALEPFIRNDMSSAAKEASQQWLTSLWDHYCADIARHRGIPAPAINDGVNRLAENLLAAGGDAGQMALNNGLVDGLKTRTAIREYLQNLVGNNDDGTSFNQVSFTDYLSSVSSKYSRPIKDEDRVAIIVAHGNIVYGRSEVGQIGSASLSKMIRRARTDEHVKALVLRVDSGGGSAFASELIRQELLLFKEANKPLVISMGSMAASGAYWIAADADKILAAPTTLTGSIGVFGAFPTFEKSLAWAGVFNDGIGTTSLAGAGDPTRALPDNFSKAVQVSVEQIYQRFIHLVANGRNMSEAEVELIAEGRVWDGAKALELGLVDQLGNLEDAVAVAADLAGVEPGKAAYFPKNESKAEQFLKSLGVIHASLFTNSSPVFTFADGLVRRLALHYNFLSAGDPQNMYTHCLLPVTGMSF